MTHYDVDCPICPGFTSIEASGTKAIFRVDGYEDDPSRRFQLLEPDPDRQHGRDTFLGSELYTRVNSECTNGHYLRLYVASYRYLNQSDCLYGPSESPDVLCTYCSYNFGPHESFNRRFSASENNHMVLRSVTEQPEKGHSELSSLNAERCAEYDRVAVKQKCGHCGELNFLNYRTLSVDRSTKFTN